MVAPDYKDASARLVEPAYLGRQEPGGLHGGLVAVIQVAHDHQGIDLLLDADIYNRRESSPRRIADQFGKIGVSKRQRPQRRVKMDVGGVNEPIRHLGETLFPLERNSRFVTIRSVIAIFQASRYFTVSTQSYGMWRERQPAQAYRRISNPG